MARSIPFSSSLVDSAAPRGRVRPARPLFGRISDWLMRAQRRSVERDITKYLQDRGVDRITDSMERTIERRFLAGRRD